MNKTLLTITGIVLLVQLPLSGKTATLTVDSANGLQEAIDQAADGDTLLLGSGRFSAKPTDMVETLCGNCADHRTSVQATVGFVIKNKQLVIRGMSRDSTTLVTHAGYGVYLESANGTVLTNLSITGGVRTSDGNATDAAIVVRRTRVIIANVHIRDNNNRSSDSSVVVGIGGIFGREGAEIIVDHCTISNGGWDGIALYRGASAFISDCTIKDGRGAGIGVTWDATCVAYRNEISGFWKGIGSFGTSSLIARNNLVHENLGWGIIATGESTLDATNNVVYHNGNCGIAPWSTEASGRFINNIIVANGWRDQWVCPCVGVWNYGDWSRWEFRNNIVWGNEAGAYEGIWDQTEVNGNIEADPMFVDDGDFHLQSDSPARNSGDSLIFNLDGTRSHIGLYGGAQAPPD